MSAELLGRNLGSECFCRLDEAPLAVLDADIPSRPNVPVNALVALEFLKAANGWSDEEMDNEFCSNFQVCYALCYRHPGPSNCLIAWDSAGKVVASGES